MKKIKNKFNMRSALIAILFLFSLNAEAQKKMEFGIRYMPTISDFEMNSSTGGTVNGEATLGYGVGALLGYNFSKNVSLQGEIIYSSISQKYTENSVEHKVNLKYINIPLLLSLNTNKYGPVNLSLVGGPQIGLNVGSSVNSTGGDGTYSSQAIVSIKKSDIGVAYGLGIDFGLNEPQTVRLGLGYRGVLGLIDISDDSKTPTSEEYYIVEQAKVKTYSLYVGLSILF
jgi:opacity protein-like surface antigen